MFATYGRDRVQAAKTRMQPLITALVERAQRDGKLRADLRPTDMLFIEFMLTSAATYAEQVRLPSFARPEDMRAVAYQRLDHRLGAVAPDELAAMRRILRAFLDL
jgi:hypothetical protein